MATDTTTTHNTNNASTDLGPSDYRAAYESTAADRAALADEDVLVVNTDLPAAVHAALGANQHVQRFRHEMDGLPVDHALIDKLETYARAAARVHADYTVLVDSDEGITDAYEAAIRLRTQLRSDAANLALHGWVDEAALAPLTGDMGHRNVAYELMSLVSIHRGALDKTAGRSAVTADDLRAAEATANRLLDTVAKRDARIKTQAETAEQRRRAFTLMLKSYEEACRAMTFVRWYSRDSDRLMPSLYTNKGNTRSKTNPTTPVAAGGAATAGSTPSGTAGAGVPGPASGNANGSSVGGGVNDGSTNNTGSSTAPGARGSNPFGG